MSVTKEYIGGLLDKYGDMVLRISYTYLKNRDDAEDVVQDVFLSVIDKCPEFKDSSHEKAWFVRAAINRCKNKLNLFWNKNKISADDVPEAPSDNAEIPNKIPDYIPGDELAAAPSPYDSLLLDDIKERVGYEFKIPQYIPEGYAMEDAALMFGSLIQISYTSENGEIIYRTEKTQEDISGDYNVYEKTEAVEAGGSTVTIKGSGGTYNLAVWNDGESYAISSSKGISKEELIKMAENIKTP